MFLALDVQLGVIERLFSSSRRPLATGETDYTQNGKSLIVCNDEPLTRQRKHVHVKSWGCGLTNEIEFLEPNSYPRLDFLVEVMLTLMLHCRDIFARESLLTTVDTSKILFVGRISIGCGACRQATMIDMAFAPFRSPGFALFSSSKVGSHF